MNSSIKPSWSLSHSVDHKKSSQLTNHPSQSISPLSLQYQSYTKVLQAWLNDPEEQTPIHCKERAVHAILNCLNNQASTLCLNNFKLKSIPPIYLLTHIDTLELSHNEIEEIHNLDLTPYKNLTHLDLSGNPLTVINGLNLSRTNIQFLTTNLLGETLKVVQNIDLSHCKNLKGLHLTGKSIHTVNNIHLSECRQLETIVIRGTNVEALDKFELSNCGSLKTIDISYNNLEKFPAWDMQDCISLEEIKAKNNAFRILPESLKSVFKQLRLLDIKNNLFFRLENWIFDTKTNTEIDYRENLTDPTYASYLTAITMKTTYNGPSILFERL